MNAFAKALNEGKFYVGNVCDDCQSVLVNGDASGNAADWDEARFNAAADAYEITPGHPHNLPEWEASIGCSHGSEPCPDDDDCYCGENDFSTSQCDGCGTYLHGSRHSFTFVKRSDLEN
jgi:hypothetical protein